MMVFSQPHFGLNAVNSNGALGCPVVGEIITVDSAIDPGPRHIPSPGKVFHGHHEAVHRLRFTILLMAMGLTP
jgi:hypothetical protein